MGIRKVAYQLVYDRLMGDIAGDGLMSVSVVLPPARPPAASEPGLVYPSPRPRARGGWRMPASGC